jgi:imidazolonepropionase-like amidohydrolase
MRHLWPLLASFVLATAANAQVSGQQLAEPPADARHFVIQSTGGKHGDSWMWTAPDGTLRGRESMNLRGQVFELDSTIASGADGMPVRLEVRGFTPSGDAAETFDVANGRAAWKSQIDRGEAAYKAPAFYVPTGGPMAATALFLERVLASPTKSLALLPGGRVRAEKLTTVEVGEGPTRQTVTAWAITGLSNAPLPAWSDAQGRFFAVSFGLAWLPDAYTGEQKKLEDAQAKAMAARSVGLAKSLPENVNGAVAFTHVRTFDADARTFLVDQTVVVENGKIVAAGPSSKVRVPKGAKVIAGRGHTLVPGLWDCHMHVGDDNTGVQELALGVTSVRDPGNDDLRTMDRRERVRKGELLMPNVYPSSLIDGVGPFTAQVANAVRSEAEAIAAVRRAKENGFTGVKFYGTLNPAWLKPAIDEAHRLGLHVHGHVPAGIRPMDAIAAGYDEVTHINWIMMQAMPASVIAVSNGFMRFEGPGRYAKDVDLNGPEISGIVKTMVDKKLYSDPTMVAFESIYVPENGDLSPSYAPFVGTLPPATERGFRAGGFQVPKDLTRADYRASWAKMVALLGRMHAAGVPIVAGTDGSGLEIVRELEVYREAGFTNADALAAATIVPATLVGAQARTGSIAVGKDADLVLVEGDPSTRLADLRQTRWVMQGGRLFEADKLRAAAGFGGRPK